MAAATIANHPVQEEDDQEVLEEEEERGLLLGGDDADSGETHPSNLKDDFHPSSASTAFRSYRIFLLGTAACLVIALMGSSVMGSLNNGSQQEMAPVPTGSDPQDSGSSSTATQAYNFDSVDKDPNGEGSVFDFGGPDSDGSEKDEVKTTTASATRTSTKSATKQDDEAEEEDNTAPVIAEPTPSANAPEKQPEDDKKKVPDGTTPEFSTTHANTVPDNLQVPHVVYNDLHYRRVCAPVGIGSTLCMTVWFPFEVPKQDPTVHYPKPFQPKFYDIDRNNLIFIDQNEVRSCEIQTMDMESMDDAVKFCIEDTVTKKGRDKVVAVWTRQRPDGTTAFHSTGLRENVDTIYDFFGDDHMILVLGMSPSPGVTKQMSAIFTFGSNCHRTGVNKKKGNWNCDRPARRRLGTPPYSTLEEGHVNFGQLGYGPGHQMPGQNFTEVLNGLHVRTAAARKQKPLRKLSLMVEFPLAHTQYESWIKNEPERIHTLTSQFSATLSAYLGAGESELKEMGFELGTLFVFDGLPQTFPTETAGFRNEIRGIHGEQGFLDSGGYPGWKPELGSSCRGPLPPNSPLKGVVEDTRKIWQNQGLDMRWYGQIWEFANLFWWQTRQWIGNRGGLDCTHVAGHPAGMSSVHKFFVQAMLEDYLETKHVR